jgi:uncharacterized membrane protein
MSRPDAPLWETLLQAGLVQGEAPATDTIESPWYVKGILAFSGWLAAMFLLGFVGVGFQFIMESGLASLITGGVMMGAAYAVLRIPKNEFVEHLALAMSIAGQALAVWAFYEILDTHGALLWALVALLQVLLAVVMPNYVHRVLSSYAAAIALSMTLASMRVPYMAEGLVMLFTAWIWLNEFRYPHYMRRMRAVGYGLVMALIQLTGTLLFGQETLHWLAETSDVGEWVPPWVGEILAGAVMLYVVWRLLQRLGMRLAEPLAMTTLLSTMLFCGVSLEARGIAAGMMIILLGFAGGNRVLLGLGIVSLLFYISSYYYLLETTLLFKSGTLLMVGVVLLAVRWLMLHVASRQKEATHG